MINTPEQPFNIKRFSPMENLNVLKSIKKNKYEPPSKQYQLTNDDQRYKVVYSILFENLSIKQAAKIYGLKYSTAKVILSLYRKEGRFNKKKERGKYYIENEDDKVKSSKVNSLIDHGSTGSAVGKEEENEPLLRDSFWSKKITEHYKRKEEDHISLINN